MRIAVLSDVHGNVPALEAVLEDIEHWAPDRIVVNGDLVNRGPCSLPCLERVRELPADSSRLKGNHEGFVIDSVDHPRDPDDPLYELYRFGSWTAAQLGAAVDEIRAWPDHLDLEHPEAGTVHITHGSREGNRSGIHPEISDAQLVAKLGDPRDLFIASHTHRPMVRWFNCGLVVNTGSVGQPFDGDPRAAYGRFCVRDRRWHAEIVRVPFDRKRALQDFLDSGFVAQAGPLASIVYVELHRAEMHLGRWMGRYLGAVKSGEISVARATREYLDELGPGAERFCP